MSENSVPPWRRRDAAADLSNPPLAEHTSSNPSHQTGRRNGGRRGHRVHGRGSKGGYRKDAFQNPLPQTDQADLYHARDIHNYFWGGEGDAADSRSSTFHDSKNRPEKLSHLLLFSGANPLWASECTVFAKSKLTLLPEYALKKAENGDWETEEQKHESVREAAKQLLDGGPESQHTAAIPKEHETTASAQASQVDCIKAETITHLSNERQNPLADESNNERDITAPVSSTHLVEEDNRIQVKQENAQDESHILSQDSTMGQQDSNLSDSSSGTGVETPKSEDFIEYEKQEDRHASPEVEVPNHEAQATSIPASSSTATISRLKPTNARRFPVDKFFQEHESVPSKSAFPFIAPIDYIPTDPLPIAIFEEQQVPGPRKGGIRGLFAFKGWFKISWINIVAPHSAELVIMLQQKWERKDRFGHAIPSKSRDASAWNASLAVEWAVIRFQLWEEKSTPPPPRIEKLPEPERPAAKSVNEILRDMRLNDGNGDEQRCENHATLEPGRDKAASEFCSGEDKCSVVT